MIWKDKKVLVTGGTGFLGRNLLPRLRELGAVVFSFSRDEYDLTKESDVARLFKAVEPSTVIHLASDVGGMGYMRVHPGSVFYNNVLMNTLVLEYSRKHDVQKVVALSSVNCYPSDAPVPFKEEYMWDGRTDEQVLGYGMAKRVMILQSELYNKQYGLQVVNLICDSIYGPHDVFEKGRSRVIPANIMRCLEAKRQDAPFINAWGTGSPERDFLYVDDAVNAIVSLPEKIDDPSPINVGTGDTITIKEVIEIIAELTGYSGEIRWDSTKPDGQLKRYLDISKAKGLGFEPKVSYREGIGRTINWYL